MDVREIQRECGRVCVYVHVYVHIQSFWCARVYVYVYLSVPPRPFLCLSLSFSLSRAHTHIQVRMSSGQAGNASAWQCLQGTVRGEGLLALYKGVVPPLLVTGSINSVLFGTQVFV